MFFRFILKIVNSKANSLGEKSRELSRSFVFEINNPFDVTSIEFGSNNPENSQTVRKLNFES